MDTGRQVEQQLLDLSTEAGAEWEGTGTEKLECLSTHNVPTYKTACPLNTSSQSAAESITFDKSLSVKQAAWCAWGKEVAMKIAALLQEKQPLAASRQWRVTLRHIEHVKSYAPHVDHLVVDLECRH